MAALSPLRSVLQKGQPHTKAELFPGNCYTDQINTVTVRQMFSVPPPLSTLRTRATGRRGTGRSPNLRCGQFPGDIAWHKTADHSLPSQVSQGETGHLLAAAHNSKWARNKGDTMADRAATSLTGAQSHSAKPEEQSRSMLAATVITGQQVRPGSQVSKTRSGPVRHVANHRHTRSIAEARAKGKVFERTNTS